MNCYVYAFTNHNDVIYCNYTVNETVNYIGGSQSII